MRMGIDARFLGEAGGFGRYSTELLAHLAEIDQNNEYLLYLTRKNFNLYEPPGPNFKKVLADCRWYTFKEQVMMPWKIWRSKPELMHFVSWNVPLLNPTKFVVTIHDLILLKYPSRQASTLPPLLYRIKNLAYRITLKRALRRAQKIIAVSEFTKRDIIENFKIEPSRIEVIYEAAPSGERGGSGVSFSALPPPQENLDKNVIQKYGITKPFFLYVGVAYPHKNLEFLIEAFRIFSQKYSREYQLVLVGKEDYFYGRLKQKILLASRLRGNDNVNERVIFAGFVPDEELNTFYTHASLYIFPSLYEGFGLPPLEAMSYGLPVLAANSSCLPEILGEAALYFDPHRPQELAELIHTTLSDQNLQSKKREAGFRQVKKYSWPAAAQKTLQLFQNIV